MKRPTVLRLLILAVVIVVGVSMPTFRAQGAEYQRQLPLGLTERFAYILEDNPLTPDKVAFGKQLFWDKRWSRSGTIACVSCHQPDHGWSDPQQFSLDFAEKPTARHTPLLSIGSSAFSSIGLAAAHRLRTKLCRGGTRPLN